LGKLFVIGREFEKKLHPEARKVFHTWNDAFQSELQLDEINDDDLKFLSDYDKIKLKRIWEITECLNKCTDIKDGDKLYDVYFGDIFWARGVISQLKRDLLNIELDIVPPLRKICEGRVAKAKEEERKRVEEEKLKAAKAEEEQREREEKEKREEEEAREEQRKREEKAEAERREKEKEEEWCAAYIAIKPPMDDAKKYLNDEEYEKFKQATWKAVEIYMGKEEDYLNDSGTFDYRLYLRKINKEKEKERRKIAANVAANEYNRRLNKEIARLQALLCPNRKGHESYFKKQIKDCRYTGQSFAQFLSSEEEQDLDRTIVDIGRKKLDEIVSSDFRQFIEGKCWRSYFLLASAEYSLEGVPCLDFMFDVFAIVEVRVWLKPGQKKFGDYVFNLPWREGKGYPVVLQEPEFLGYHYLVLIPKDLGGYSFWQSIPLVLLRGLLNGETKPNGTTISAASNSMITYKIPEFKEEVNIPDNFASYLRSIGSIDEMSNMGIVTEKVASVAKSELGELKVEQQVLSLEGKTIRKDSKKARAFALFSQGRRPSDPEVQALGVKPETTYRYHQEWKKTYSNSHNSA